MRNLLSNPNLTKEEIDKRVDHVSKIMLHSKDAITAEYQERYHKLFNRDRTDAFFKNYSHQIEEMLLPNVPPTFVSCSFNGLLCGAENFSSFTSSYSGQCFTFNSGKNGSPSLKATMAGKNNGLKLPLNIQRDSYLSIPSNLLLVSQFWFMTKIISHLWRNMVLGLNLELILFAPLK